MRSSSSSRPRTSPCLSCDLTLSRNPSWSDRGGCARRKRTIRGRWGRSGQARLDHQLPHAVTVATSHAAHLLGFGIAQGILPTPHLILGRERQAWLELDAASYIHLD